MFFWSDKEVKRLTGEVDRVGYKHHVDRATTMVVMLKDSNNLINIVNLPHDSTAMGLAGLTKIGDRITVLVDVKTKDGAGEYTVDVSRGEQVFINHTLESRFSSEKKEVRKFKN